MKKLYRQIRENWLYNKILERERTTGLNLEQGLEIKIPNRFENPGMENCPAEGNDLFARNSPSFLPSFSGGTTFAFKAATMFHRAERRNPITSEKLPSSQEFRSTW